MGVDLNLYLPLDVSTYWITDAVGVVAGLPSQLKTSGLDKWRTTHVEGVTLAATSVAGMGSIELEFPDKRPFLDGEYHHSATYHFATEYDGKFYNVLLVRSGAFWIAAAEKAARFFGGILIYQDSEEYKLPNRVRFKRSCPTRPNGLLPDDAELWDKAQEAMSKLKPITAADLIKANERAAYKLESETIRRLKEMAKAAG